MAATLVMAGHTGQDVHPFFKTRQNLDLGPQPSSDSEEPLRKRQRTQSPHDQPAIVSQWEKERADGIVGASALEDVHERFDTKVILEQVKEQTNDNAIIQTESAVETALPDDQALELRKEGDTNTSLRRTPPKKMLKVRPNGKLASPKAPVEYLEINAAEISQDADPPKKRASRISKRNFKISANGTLDLHSAQATIDSPKRRGRKKKSEAESVMEPTCIAVLNYPVVDDVDASIGRQVDEILSGKRDMLHLKPGTSREPPKSTHPFFTGELGRKPDLESGPAGGSQIRITDSEGVQSQKTMPTQTYSGPRQSRITTKPPGAGRQFDDVHDGNLPTFGTDHAKVTRFPGAVEPSWPPFEMVHVGYSSDDVGNRNNALEGSQTLERGRKLKDTQIQISPEENILNDMARAANFSDDHNTRIQRQPRLGACSFRRPHRKVMTGTHLQQVIRSRVSSFVSNSLAGSDLMDDELSNTQTSSGSPHKSLLDLMHRLPNSHSAFDKFQCETEEWTHKYSPKCAEHVLQQGREAEILRDWLKKSTVSSVEGGGDECRTRDSSVMGRRGGMKIGRKKKRKAEGLDDFVVSSDDEADEMAEIADTQDSGPLNCHDKKSLMRAGAVSDGERSANAVIISGPHGCGKSAAVFAVAKELDFEVFEVNAGSRRSGKDVVDRVGDMTRNHLVQHRPDPLVTDSVDPSSDLLQVDEKLQADLNSGRQGTMQSFFKVQAASKPTIPKARESSTKPESKKNKPKKKILQEVLSKPRDQKQSLILLEEVDVLFEEDKLFWATVLDVLSRSKRPVIMTCSDESLVPLDDMALHAILRFHCPPTDLATDYLLLVAASEGHLLSRESVQSLYEVKGLDLRAAMVELNFYCQMGVGDSKGGLEWMLLDAPERSSGNAEPLRVISEDSYLSGMGWLGGDDASSQTYQNLDEVIELSAKVWDGWHVDLGSTDLLEPIRSPQSSNKSRKEVLCSLNLIDQSCEAFSAADILPASVVRQDLSIKIDTTQPKLNEQTRCSYIDGPRLLQVDPLIGYLGTSESLAYALRASAVMTGEKSKSFSISVWQVNQTIPLVPRLSRQPGMNLSNMLSTFQPIADDHSSTFAISKHMSSSCLDGPLSTILEDVAPYVRGIVSYDLRLEEQRRQLSNLLIQPGSGNKKTRKTRASRAALEGGNKADIRRERWFPKQTDFDSVLATGGKEWQKVALRMSLEHAENRNVDQLGSRRSSITSGAGTDI